MSQILDGKIVRDAIKAKLKVLVSEKEGSAVPSLAIIQIGDNSSSAVYIQQKINFGKDVGVEVGLHHLDENVSEEEVSSLVQKLNAEEKVGGIIIQLPLPAHLDSQKLIDLIDAEKDVDGLSSHAKMFPATARGIISLLEHYDISVEGKKALVIGRSKLVGKPTAQLLEQKGAVIASANSETTPEELVSLCHDAEIIVVATGVPSLVNMKHVLPKHVIIDVGITRTDEGIVGDVDFNAVKDHVTAISPVPGGVGPLTVASLFQNLLRVQ